jgi:hypothetical protein
MMHYGDRLPGFIETFEPLAHIGYLADAARLDLALRQSYHAADAAGFDPARLQALAPDQLLEATFTLAPATRIIRSAWPLHDIWLFNQSADAPRPRSIAQDVLITRPQFDPAPHALPPGGADWLLSLRDDQTLGDAIEVAATAAPDFDLTACLTLIISAQGVANIAHKDLA